MMTRMRYLVHAVGWWRSVSEQQHHSGTVRLLHRALGCRFNELPPLRPFGHEGLMAVRMLARSRWAHNALYCELVASAADYSDSMGVNQRCVQADA